MSAAGERPSGGNPSLHVTAPEVGFVGTTAGMTGAQLRSVQIVLMEYGPVEVHLAGRPGADEEVSEIADRLRLWRMVHPGIVPGQGLACVGDVQYRAKPDDERFSDIVGAVGMLVAAPRDAHPTEGCRTWWTTARAREAGIPVVLVRPDGSTWRWERRRRG